MQTYQKSVTNVILFFVKLYFQSEQLRYNVDFLYKANT